MKPKTIESIILEAYYRGKDGKGFSDFEMKTTLAQIQQLLEECEPPAWEATSWRQGVEKKGYDRAIESYKSNIRGKLK